MTQNFVSMRPFLLISLPLCYGAEFFRNRNQQAVIELALCQQLATYAQTGSKPRLSPLDRAFWGVLFRFWSERVHTVNRDAPEARAIEARPSPG
jgi:hypothetical protein